MEGIQVVQVGAEVNHAFGNEGFTALYVYCRSRRPFRRCRWEVGEVRVTSRRTQHSQCGAVQYSAGGVE